VPSQGEVPRRAEVGPARPQLARRAREPDRQECVSVPFDDRAHAGGTSAKRPEFRALSPLGRVITAEAVTGP